MAGGSFAAAPVTTELAASARCGGGCRAVYRRDGRSCDGRSLDGQGGTRAAGCRAHSGPHGLGGGWPSRCCQPIVRTAAARSTCVGVGRWAEGSRPDPPRTCVDGGSRAQRLNICHADRGIDPSTAWSLRAGGSDGADRPAAWRHDERGASSARRPPRRSRSFRCHCGQAGARRTYPCVRSSALPRRRSARRGVAVSHSACSARAPADRGDAVDDRHPAQHRFRAADAGGALASADRRRLRRLCCRTDNRVDRTRAGTVARRHVDPSARRLSGGWICGRLFASRRTPPRHIVPRHRGFERPRVV